VTGFYLALGFAVLTLSLGCTGTQQPNRSDQRASVQDGSTIQVSPYGWGNKPLLTAPAPQRLPTIKPARAIGWDDTQGPIAPPGTRVTRYAQGLSHPRWLYVLPNGDILVAETDSPAPTKAQRSPVAWVKRNIMRFAGSGYPSANRIRRLAAPSDNGVGEENLFIEGLHSPFGMALLKDTLYVANTDAILAFDYPVDGKAAKSGRSIASLPAAGANSHWTKNLLADPANNRLFVAIGSNSNIGEAGPSEEIGRAGIFVLDLATGAFTPFASGLRNPVGMALHPVTRELWTVVNERDQLGNDLVPDYLTKVRQSDDFGWPTHYWGIFHDPRVPKDWHAGLAATLTPTRPVGEPDRQPRRIPNFALGAHTASLGLAFYPADGPIKAFRGHAIISQRGSWNRNPRSGYQVIAVPFNDEGMPAGEPKPVLTGFLNARGQAQGRPVGVAIDQTGAILIADDVGGIVWRVSADPT